MTAFLTQDFPMLAAGLLASIACGLIGSFLVLRRMSLMGDAISHAVLPGIVLAFVLAKSLAALPVFIGAAALGVITAGLTELIHRVGKVESGASMGVVFTVLFAIGVIMLAQIEQTEARGVHIDADCVLHGAMESALWLNPPTNLHQVMTGDAWKDFPPQVTTLALVLAVNLIFIVALFKELRIAAFDPGLAKAQGINPNLMHYLLMTMVAITTIASFEAVGSILVVAMLIVPGLIGHLLCDRLAPMLWVSALAAAIAAIGGFTTAAAFDLNAAGMIGVALGALLGIVCAVVYMRSRRLNIVATQLS